MAATLTFYRRLGRTIDTPSAEHAVASCRTDFAIEFDSPDFARVWDSSYEGALGGAAGLGRTTETRDEVDEFFADLVAHGHCGRQPPYDAFWGSRFAIVDDPDGNPVGLMSPRDESQLFWPPSAPLQAPAALNTNIRPPRTGTLRDRLLPRRGSACGRTIAPRQTRCW